MDNGQHVFLRCCGAYRALLARLGSERLTAVQPRLEIPVLKPGSRPTVLRRGSLPRAAAARRRARALPHLSRSERLGAARAALGLMRLDPDEEALDRVSFGEWLARHGQGPRAIAALWDLIALPTLNLPAARGVAGALGVRVPHGAASAPRTPATSAFTRHTLAETIGAPAERALEEAGVRGAARLARRALAANRGRRVLEVHARRRGRV